jgi:formamidopyrimidine-DNA glycosylase
MRLLAGSASYPTPVPELPEVTLYVERLEALLGGQPLERVRVASPFLVRTAAPPLKSAEGRRVVGARRIGKRVVLRFEGELFLVFHLMIAGRFHWRKAGAGLQAKVGLAAFDFPNGTLALTEASTKKRASLHVVEGEAALAQFERGGVEPLDASAEAFAGALRRESHTVKRALTDPTLFSGIGNAYSDEILHRARLSPVTLTRRLTDEEVARLHAATQGVLRGWVERARAEVGDGFPEKVTAFREGFAVHGRFGQPCPVCTTPVQRLRYAENEANYCPTCQTGGRLLADRSLSRLLKDDWPRTLDELEQRKVAGRR